MNLDALSFIFYYINLSLCIENLHNIRERVSKFILMRLVNEMKKNAMLTVEAALVLPIFVYGVMAFLYLFEVMYLQEEIQEGLTKTAQFSSQYFRVLQEVNTDKRDSSLKKGGEKVIATYFLHQKLAEYVDVNKINGSMVKGGYNGISMLCSSVSQESNIIDIVAVYHIKLPLPIIKLKKLTMIQRVRTRGFVGLDMTKDNLNNTDVSSEKEKMVFVTENGVVYHLNSNCPYLDLSIQKRMLSEVKGLRNMSGCKYGECEYCTGHDQQMKEKTIYITKYGGVFHYSLSCPGLKRTIYRIPLSKVGDKKICNKCGEGRK